jgi:hypothetical protein
LQQVCPETIYLAKLTFLYKGIIAGYANTKKVTQRGKKVLSKKRRAEGITVEADKASGYISDEGSDEGRNNHGSLNIVPQQAFAYLV